MVLFINHTSYWMQIIEEEYPDKAIIVKDCSFSWEPRKPQKLVISDKYRDVSQQSDASKGSSHKVHIDIELENKAERDIQDFQSTQIHDTQNKSIKESVLEDIKLSVEKGKLIGIYGAVGSGKSSLLFGILGEMQVLCILFLILSENLFAGSYL